MKNPFEIRYDLIALAHDRLEAQFNANTKFAQELIKEAVAAGQAYIDAVAKFMPKYPSIDDILSEAKKFSYFVDNK